MPNDYDYWHDRLAVKAGEKSQWQGDDPHEKGLPQCGFWRTREYAKGPYIGVAIWKDGNGWMIQRGHTSPYLIGVLQHTAWLNFLDAVSYDDYMSWNTNSIWPGEVEIAGIGDNSGGADAEASTLRDAIARTIGSASTWLGKHKEITCQLEADTAANYRDSLNGLRKKAETAHKDAKEPLQEAVRACDQEWKPIIASAEETASELRNAITAYGKKLEAEEAKRVAAERARIEAERKELEDQDMVLAAITPIEEVKERKVAFGGQLGKKTSMKGNWIAEITDFDAALMHFKDHSKVVELIQTLANAEARSKTRKPIPGVEFKEKRTAV